MESTNGKIRSVAIVGGGSAGWITAVALARSLQDDCTITLVESDLIGTVGVGEATVPFVRQFNSSLGIDENELLKSTQGTIKLGIQFNDWTRLGYNYFHPFGQFGMDFDIVPFEYYWMQERRKGKAAELEEYCMAIIAARENRFQPPSNDLRLVQSTYDYAYHIDAGLYAKFLRALSEDAGVTRVEGHIVDVLLDDENGFIESVRLEDGQEISADLFVDCSGLRGLLIEESLKTGYEDWSHWLPCDRAVAIPCEHGGEFTPYTQSTALEAGWQWRIPLQQRIGNGHVYCSRHVSDDEATTRLLDNLDGKPLADPNLISFTTGCRKMFWNKNCVAIGLSAGFMEPLESTSLHLIQTAVGRLLSMFPNRDFDQFNIDEYNRLTRTEYEWVRDFLILHYHATEREDTDFWRDCAAMSIPDELGYRIEKYKALGHVGSTAGMELFSKPSWLAVMIGQLGLPDNDIPIIQHRTEVDAESLLAEYRSIAKEAALRMPTHGKFIRRNCRADLTA
jgi:tryptophan halogenase